MTSKGLDSSQAVVGLKYSRFDFLRSLPHGCIGFLLCIAFYVTIMVVYAAVLISTGANVSAFYFAAIILASAAMPSIIQYQ